MKANVPTLQDLFKTVNTAYVVPDYQRPFAWTKERAATLLSAILGDAHDDQELTSIGAFLLCELPKEHACRFRVDSPSSIAPRQLWEVVDGQQRLTILALLGFALKQRHAALAAEGLVYAPPLEFEMMYSNFRSVRGARVPMIIRDGDNFDSGMRSELGQTLHAFIAGAAMPSGQIAEVFKGIVGWVEHHLKAHNFGLFCDYLLERCIYIQVEADTPDQAFTMFEPLNSTSEPLTAFEVFRAKAVRECDPKPVFEKTASYLNYRDSKRDDVIKRTNDLVFAVAQSYSGTRLRIRFVPLKKYLEKRVNPCFIENVEKASEFLDGVWESQGIAASWFDANAKDHIRFLKASSHTAAMPVLLRYYQSSPACMADAAGAIAAFWALWRAAFPTHKLPRVYRALLSNGGPDDMSIESGVVKSVSDLKAYLRKELEGKIGQSTPADTKTAWMSKAATTLSYDEMKVICRFFIFVDLGTSLKQNLIPNDPWTKRDDIEHVLPEGGTYASGEMHRIGNLTFLPPEVNRSLQAMDWTRKREAYRWLSSSLRPTPVPTVFADGSPIPPGVISYLRDSSSLALAYLGPIAANPVWGDQEISLRTQAILDTAWQELYQSRLH
jgi:hypothetical protein